MKENKVLKYSYILIGLIFLIASATFFSWFYTDFIYLFTKPAILYGWARLGAFLSSLILGVFYLTYGIKSYRINRLSNLSLIVLLCSIALSFIFITIYSGGNYIGRPSLWYASYAYLLSIIILIGGILVAFILCILSMIKNKKSN